MEIIYYFGSDKSIYDSLESLSKIKKNFIIKNIDNITKRNLNDSILILDDSFKDFLKFIRFYSKKNKANLIITTKKENITVSSIQNLKFFLKPIKVIDLYKEILKKIRNNVNDLSIYVNHSDFNLVDKKGKKLKLTEKEFKLVEILLENSKKASNKKNLLYKVWGIHSDKADSLNTRVLETLISRIRKKIIVSKINIKIIKNKSGYILIK